MNDIVKYRNEFNLVGMRDWNKTEMDFLFAVMSKIKEKGTQELHFDLDELKLLTQFDPNKEKERWLKSVRGAVNKVASLVYWEENEEHMKAMPLFLLFDINLKKYTLDVAVSPYFEYILNNLHTNFTRFELSEFLEIRSTYAKTMYRLLKQWRTIGKHEWSVENFRAILGIPDSYKASHVQTRVLKPILKELPSFFPDLKVKTIKSNKRGNPVLGYEFTWKPEKTGEWKEDKYKKNDFYKPKNITSNVPDWVEKEYKHSATAEEQAKLEELRRSMFED